MDEVKTVSTGVKIMQRRNNYPAAEYLSGTGAGAPKIRKKIIRKISQRQKLAKNQLTASNTILRHCRKHTIP